jgi:hypothetical protein
MDSLPSDSDGQDAGSREDARADAFDRGSDGDTFNLAPEINPSETAVCGMPADGSPAEHRDMLPRRTRPRLVRCLVTQVDGSGRGSIGLSVSNALERRTAAFLCDVRSGICDALGEVEPESATAGGLLDELEDQAESECARDVPDLALGLLSGSLTTCASAVPPTVREWLDLMLGPDFQASPVPATIAGIDPSSISAAEMATRVRDLLERCPSWLDLSPLTFQLAEEIRLREGSPDPDPARDAGIYRFLFERRLIGRLELYRRMLLWMAWFWKSSGLDDLSTLALACATELSDEQYAVPSHPFTVELTTRSLLAAQQLSSSRIDPRRRG